MTIASFCRASSSSSLRRKRCRRSRYIPRVLPTLLLLLLNAVVLSTLPYYAWAQSANETDVPTTTDEEEENGDVGGVGGGSQDENGNGDDNLKEYVLRAGVINAPPFAMYFEENNTYAGFEIDLTAALEDLAAENGYRLRFDLSNASRTPTQYNDAFDLIASDCLEVSATPENCDMFDIILGDYYLTNERSQRAYLTPAWLNTRVSSMKVASVGPYDGLQSANDDGGLVCVPAGTYLAEQTKSAFPDAAYVDCPSQTECVETLKAGKCTLYVEDQLLLRYRASTDPSLSLTNDGFNVEYIVWPARFNLPQEDIYTNLENWLFALQTDGTLNELTTKWFGSADPISVSTEDLNPTTTNGGGSSGGGTDGIAESSSTGNLRRWTAKSCTVLATLTILLSTGLDLTST